MLTPANRLEPNQAEVASKVIDGEAVMINLSNGTYYSMDGSGGFIWSIIQDGCTVEEIVQAVAEQYDVTTAQARADLDRLATEMLDERLVFLVTEGSDTVTTFTPPAEREAYTPPHLHTYKDMGDLLALDPPMPGLTDIPWEGSSD